jgi:uncharacterized protein HemX
MEPALWAGVGVLFTTVVGAVVAAFLKIRESKFSQDQTTRAQTITEYKDVITNLQTSQKETKEELDHLRDEHETELRKAMDCERRAARLEAWQEYMESVLRANGIQFTPFSAGPGSGVQKSVPNPPTTG